MKLKNTKRTMANIALELFDDDKLNVLGNELILLDKEYIQYIDKAEKNLYNAFETRWRYGKLISENTDYIKETCGSQKEFGNRIGKSEGVISNNKRAYEDLLDQGAKTWDDVLELLDQKNIKPTVRNFEKIGNLLNEPKKDINQKDQISKDRKRLESIYEEANDILKRVEPANKPDLKEDAFSLVEDIDEIISYLDSFDPKKTQWEKKVYMDHVRNFGKDLITFEPCEKCDAHHTDEYGGSGAEGKKLPDYYAIPVSRTTHMAIESGLLVPSKEDILRAQFIVMSSFLTLNMN